ncbi:MAG: hypothetical protein KIT84_24545 [Labilithrix sp.]|nr:hypothetical protein [Labilithrix sp.]MCW5814219.1 hypothetical protein [Labilithrix sp.]
MTPLPGGFPANRSVENAATVRISKPGLAFVEQNLAGIASTALEAPGGIVDFPVPTFDFDSTVSGRACPDGPDPTARPPRCIAQANVGAAKFQIDAVTPNALRVKATLPLKLDDIPVAITSPSIGTVHIGYGANTSCDAEKPNVTPKDLPLTITIPIAAETVSPRQGYSKVDVDGAVVDLSELKSDDVRICATCGIFPASFCNSVLNSAFLKGAIVDRIKGSLDEQLKTALKDYLCTAPNPTLVPACPLDSAPDAESKYCVYDADKTKCVPTLLGTDAHVDLGGFLASVSPTTAGGIDFGVASFGPMKPLPSLPEAAGRTPNGITLGMVGGVLPQPLSKCVPQALALPPTGIPVPDELAPAAAEPAGTPHVGVALSGRFLEYAFTNVYNAGLLCLGVSTEQFDLLKSGILSILIPSMKTLTFDQADAAAAIATRPQKPPVVKLGGGTDPKTDPLLTLVVPSLAIDFYVWSFDRYARVFTYTADLTVPVTLMTASGGIVPSIGEVTVTNGVVTNGDTLLLDNPATVAESVSAIVGSLSQQLVGAGLAPISLSGAVSSLGLDLAVDKIARLQKGSDEFVGVFATFTKPAPKLVPDTRGKLIGKEVDPKGLDGSHLPALALAFESSIADRPIEYSWWIDNGTRSPWSREANPVLRTQQLLLQGRHVLRVTSRIVGDVASEDPTPAEIPFTIDGLAPIAKLTHEDGARRVEAWDLVSTNDALRARVRTGDGAFGAWQPLAALSLPAGDAIEVEVADEEGNVAALRDAAPAPRAASGCSSSGGSASAGGVLLLAAALALALRRRRVALALAVAGCGSDAETKTQCGSDCNQACLTGLATGQPGAFLSVAKANDGAVWAAGYNDSAITNGEAMPFGDLVVGKYDPGTKAVAWQTVDGVPARSDGTCATYGRGEWRGGETAAGDNVGRWASLQIGAAGQPLVAYYDDTNHRLKLALFEENAWRTFVLAEDKGADVGRYVKMVIDQDKPVIAFMRTEEGVGGNTRSKVVLARSKTSTPRERVDFTFEDIAVDEDGPCGPSTCGSGSVCIKSTGTCLPVSNGCDRCEDGEACVEDVTPVCLGKASEVEAYPKGIGAGISLAAGPFGLGLVAYDGHHGNLVALIDRGAVPWDRVILDGETGSRADKTQIDTGNAGASASLAIDDGGKWSVSYVDATSQTLRYFEVVGGKPGRPEIVDDGSSVDGQAFGDGRHVIGADSQVRAQGDTITILYADSTSLGARRAVGRGDAASRTWELYSIKKPDTRWIAFPRFAGDDLMLAWWRKSSAETRSVEGNVFAIEP